MEPRLGWSGSAPGRQELRPALGSPCSSVTACSGWEPMLLEIAARHPTGSTLPSMRPSISANAWVRSKGASTWEGSPEAHGSLPKSLFSIPTSLPERSWRAQRTTSVSFDRRIPGGPPGSQRSRRRRRISFNWLALEVATSLLPAPMTPIERWSTMSTVPLGFGRSGKCEGDNRGGEGDNGPFGLR